VQAPVDGGQEFAGAAPPGSAKLGERDRFALLGGEGTKVRGGVDRGRRLFVLGPVDLDLRVRARLVDTSAKVRERGDLRLDAALELKRDGGADAALLGRDLVVGSLLGVVVGTHRT